MLAYCKGYVQTFLTLLMCPYRCSSLENECEDTKREKSALEVRITEMQRRRYANSF